MTKRGWKQLLASNNRFQGEGKYPIPAYSEFVEGGSKWRRRAAENGGSRLGNELPWCFSGERMMTNRINTYGKLA
jgi:hypothetical protein